MNKEVDIRVYSKILHDIDLYKEISMNRYGIRRKDRINRCDIILNDFEIFTNLDNAIATGLRAKVTWQALWNAVHEYDVPYEGKRYKFAMMSEILSSIVKKELAKHKGSEQFRA